MLRKTIIRALLQILGGLVPLLKSAGWGNVVPRPDDICGGHETATAESSKTSKKRGEEYIGCEIHHTIFAAMVETTSVKIHCHQRTTTTHIIVDTTTR